MILLRDFLLFTAVMCAMGALLVVGTAMQGALP